MNLSENKPDLCIIGGTSEARKFGETLDERGIDFTFTMTTEPMVKYSFPIQKTKIENFEMYKNKAYPLFSNGNSYEKGFDLVIDFTHPHARLIDKSFDKIPENMLWRFQRKPILSESETVKDYVEMAQRVKELNPKKILSFLGFNGINKLKVELKKINCHAEIFSRSIKSSKDTVHIQFQPSMMKKKEELVKLIEEINPDIAVLKDSGENGGTASKRNFLKSKNIPFIGLKMPLKKHGRIYTDEKELLNDFLEGYFES